jgi:ketosteroid isomerase-like protein
VTSPLELVRALHSAEGGTLVRELLFEVLDADVAWEVAGSPELLPWAGVFRGREAVRGWLETLNAHMEYGRFELLEIYGDEDLVVEIVQAAGLAVTSNRSFESDVVRIWTFRGGKAVRVRSYYDTAAYERAFLGG